MVPLFKMIRYRNLLLLKLVALVLGLLLLCPTDAEEECLSGKSYWCYECDSWSDPRCKDPFNASFPTSELPPLKQCEGCCVKIVTNYNKPNEQVRRTCTKSISINLFMVDHVCMYEGHKIGHMCFCEGDQCNDEAHLQPSPVVILLFNIACIFVINLITTKM